MYIEKAKKVLQLSERARLLQFVEERAEAAQAAAKLARILDGENPSPVSEEKAREMLTEEVADGSPEQSTASTKEAKAMDQRNRFFYEGVFDEQICGKCRYHRKDDYYNPLAPWVCQNIASIYEGDETEYDDTCSEFEPRR